MERRQWGWRRSNMFFFFLLLLLLCFCRAGETKGGPSTHDCISSVLLHSRVALTDQGQDEVATELRRLGHSQRPQPR